MSAVESVFSVRRFPARLVNDAFLHQPQLGERHRLEGIAAPG